LKKFIKTGLFILLLLTPFFSSHLHSWFIFFAHFLVLTLFFLKIFFLHSTTGKIEEYEIFSLFLLPALFLSLLHTTHLWGTIEESIKVITYLSVFSLSSQIFTPAENKKLLKIILISSFFVCLYGLFQYTWGFKLSLQLVPDDTFLNQLVRLNLEKKRIFSTFLLPNTLAGYLIMVIPLTMSCFFIFPQQKVVISSLLGLLLVTLFLTFSLGGWLSFLFSFFIFFGLLRFYRLKVFSIRRATPIITLLLITGASLFWLRRADFKSYQPVLTRFLTWQTTWSMIKKHPEGIGLGNFGLIYPQFQPTHGVPVQHSHNSFLELIVELGWVGGGLFFFSLFLLFTFILKIFSEKDSFQSEENKTIALGFLSGGVGFWVHNLVDFGWYIPNLSLLWWFFLGFLMANIKKRKGTKLFSFYKKIRFLSGLVLVIYFLYLLLIYSSQIYWKKGKNASTWQERVEAYQQAQKLNPLHYLPPAHLGYTYKALFERGKREKIFLKKAISYYQKAIQLNPSLPYLHKDIALLLWAAGEREKAISALQKAHQLYPAKTHYQTLLSHFSQKLEKAKKNLTKERR
jgi:O-antigen ligase